MKTIQLFKRNLVLLALPVLTILAMGLLVSCANKDDDGSGSGGSISTSKYKIVDPYIIGATLYVDENKNGTFDTNEPTSTVSDSQGGFDFEDYTPQNGDIIRVKTQGKHNGLTYKLDLSFVVTSDGGVVSPLSTIGESRDLSNAQIVSILTDAGLTGITEADISEDPMSGVLGKTSIEDTDLLKLQASLATYGLLSIIDKANDMTPTNIKGSGFVTDTVIKQATKQMVGFIKDSLTKTLLGKIQALISSNPQAPGVNSDVIVKVSVAIMDKLIEVGKASITDKTSLKTATSTGGAIQTAAIQIMAKQMKIGQYAYGCENKDTLSAFISYLPADVQNGVKCESEFFMLNDSYDPVKAED